jgi:hypothetical protein
MLEQIRTNLRSRELEGIFQQAHSLRLALLNATASAEKTLSGIEQTEKTKT